MKPEKPNQTQTGKKTEPNRKKIKPNRKTKQNRKNRAKPSQNQAKPKKPSQTDLNRFLSKKTVPNRNRSI
jgi:hypothetical protein